MSYNVKISAMTLKQLIPSEYCLNCKGCCRFTEKESVWTPHLLKEDINTIKKKNIQLKHNTGENNYYCSYFRNSDNTCAIYDMRPFECKLYPFLINKDNDNIYLTVDTNCPYISEIMGSNNYNDYISYINAFLIGPSFIDNLKEPSHIIHEYKDTLNIKKLL